MDSVSFVQCFIPLFIIMLSRSISALEINLIFFLNHLEPVEVFRFGFFQKKDDKLCYEDMRRRAFMQLWNTDWLQTDLGLLFRKLFSVVSIFLW